MTRYRILTRMGALSLIAVSALIGVQSAEGADHTDSPSVSAEPLTDIGDFYAWMNADASRLNLIATVSPFATASTQFSDAVQYGFHVSSSASFGATASDEARVLCQFYDVDGLECWVLADDGSVADYVAGDPSDPAGLVSDSGAIRVFAGLRDDPFFFNLDGFTRTVETVRGAAGSLEFDEGGCPTVDADTSAELVRQLTSDADDSAATDDLDNANILALVIQVDKTLVNTGGPIVAVWSSTHQAD